MKQMGNWVSVKLNWLDPWTSFALEFMFTNYCFNNPKEPAKLQPSLDPGRLAKLQPKNIGIWANKSYSHTQQRKNAQIRKLHYARYHKTKSAVRWRVHERWAEGPPEMYSRLLVGLVFLPKERL